MIDNVAASADRAVALHLCEDHSRDEQNAERGGQCKLGPNAQVCDRSNSSILPQFVEKTGSQALPEGSALPATIDIPSPGEFDSEGMRQIEPARLNQSLPIVTRLRDPDHGFGIRTSKEVCGFGIVDPGPKHPA
ncbi:hypothetical protein [Bradyrhizobium sp. Ec3.3]|uniref:hypothetical protein n=1 Tax=Bradyrhizobium sp. Ec3.3 TaxID=189753 RepID=UPI0018DDEC3C|nr:hypothetical protein [Bradyrhizobium sp. Ec3.3]